MSWMIFRSEEGAVRRGVARMLVGLISVSLVVPVAGAADASRRSEFEQWQASQTNEYQAWLSEQDRAFSEALRKDWEDFQVEKPRRRDPAPKPTMPPEVPEPKPVTPVPKPEPKPVPPPPVPKPEPKPVPPPPVPKPEPKPVPPPPPPPPVPKPEPKPVPPPPPPVPKPEPKPVPPPPPPVPRPEPKPVPPPPPPVPKPEPKPVPQPIGATPVSVQMFGEPIPLNVPTKLGVSFAGRPTPAVIATHFERLASVPGTQELVDSLAKISAERRLNAWGRLVLLNEVSAGMHDDDITSRRLLTWFLAMKSGIDARIGYSDSSVQLLLPFTTMVYGVGFFEMDGQNFYLVDPADPHAATPGTLSTYRQPYAKAQVVDLTFRDALLTREKNPPQRTMTFSFKGQKYTVKVTPEPARVGVYDSVPITDLAVYFNSTWNSPARDQLRAQLQPLLKGRSERESVNFLLRFIQKGIDYKTDDEQFKRENYLFPDQTLFYPFADCEDRSILFAALVKDLLGLQVVGIMYPGHVAAAVLIPVVGAEDTIEWQGKRYVVTDPTYIGADAGMAMPGMTAASARVVEIAAASAK